MLVIQRLCSSYPVLDQLFSQKASEPKISEVTEQGLRRLISLHPKACPDRYASFGILEN